MGQLKRAPAYRPMDAAPVILMKSRRLNNVIALPGLAGIATHLSQAGVCPIRIAHH